MDFKRNQYWFCSILQSYQRTP